MSIVIWSTSVTWGSMMTSGLSNNDENQSRTDQPPRLKYFDAHWTWPSESLCKPNSIKRIFENKDSATPAHTTLIPRASSTKFGVFWKPTFIKAARSPGPGPSIENNCVSTFIFSVFCYAWLFSILWKSFVSQLVIFPNFRQFFDYNRERITLPTAGFWILDSSILNPQSF